MCFFVKLASINILWYTNIWLTLCIEGRYQLFLWLPNLCVILYLCTYLASAANFTCITFTHMSAYLFNNSYILINSLRSVVKWSSLVFELTVSWKNPNIASFGMSQLQKHCVKVCFHTCVRRTQNSGLCLSIYRRQRSQANPAFASKAFVLATKSQMLNFCEGIWGLCFNTLFLQPMETENAVYRKDQYQEKIL